MWRVLLQGALIGMAKMIPGFSGSLLAITFGVYENALDIIADLKSITKRKLWYLLLLGSGIIIGIVIFSYVVKFLLDSMYFSIMLLFIGLIIGNTQRLWQDAKSYSHPTLGVLIFIGSFLMVGYFFTNKVAYMSLPSGSFLYFFLGIVESFTTLIPGISGTAVYIMLGVYDIILSLYINFFNPENLLYLVFYFLGFSLGVIFLAKLLTFILKRYRQILYIMIVGFMCGVIATLIQDVFSEPFKIIDVILGILFLIIGYFSSSRLNHLF